jgi:hypothetical protein
MSDEAFLQPTSRKGKGLHHPVLSRIAAWTLRRESSGRRVPSPSQGSGVVVDAASCGHSGIAGGTRHLDCLAVFVYGRTVPSRRCLWALALGLVVPLGCGPVEYLTRVSSRAASALAQAGREGAEQKAPYEYAKAAEYYHKAREDAAHSYYQTAIDWGRRSEDCSRKAIARAKQSQPAGAGAHPDHTTCGGP